jgi:hypothetical protein
MQPDPRAIIEKAARTLLSALGDCSQPLTLRVAEVDGRYACLIQVWDSAEAMPLIGPERRQRPNAARVECKTDIVEVMRNSGHPLTRKEIVRELRLAGKHHGVGTVDKALADLTATGGLVNPRDKKGYRLADWMRRRRTPSLFE